MNLSTKVRLLRFSSKLLMCGMKNVFEQRNTLIEQMSNKQFSYEPNATKFWVVDITSRFIYLVGILLVRALAFVLVPVLVFAFALQLKMKMQLQLQKKLFLRQIILLLLMNKDFLLDNYFNINIFINIWNMFIWNKNSNNFKFKNC